MRQELHIGSELQTETIITNWSTIKGIRKSKFNGKQLETPLVWRTNWDKVTLGILSVALAQQSSLQIFHGKQASYMQYFPCMSSIFRSWLTHFSAQARKIKKPRSDKSSYIFFEKSFSIISGNGTYLYFLKESFYISENGTLKPQG